MIVVCQYSVQRYGLVPLFLYTFNGHRIKQVDEIFSEISSPD